MNDTLVRWINGDRNKPLIEGFICVIDNPGVGTTPWRSNDRFVVKPGTPVFYRHDMQTGAIGHVGLSWRVREGQKAWVFLHGDQYLPAIERLEIGFSVRDQPVLATPAQVEVYAALVKEVVSLLAKFDHEAVLLALQGDMTSDPAVLKALNALAQSYGPQALAVVQEHLGEQMGVPPKEPQADVPADMRSARHVLIAEVSLTDRPAAVWSISTLNERARRDRLAREWMKPYG